METEEQLTMMKLAGLEVTHEPYREKGLRVAKVWRGPELLLERQAHPEDTWASEMNIVFGFYLMGLWAEDKVQHNLRTPTITAGQVAGQVAGQYNLSNQQLATLGVHNANMVNQAAASSALASIGSNLSRAYADKYVDLMQGDPYSRLVQAKPIRKESLRSKIRRVVGDLKRSLA